LARVQRLDVVGELGVKKSGRVVPRDGDERVMGEVGDEVGLHGTNMGTAVTDRRYSEALARDCGARIEARLRPSRMVAIAIRAMALATLALIAAPPGPAAPRLLAATAVACAARAARGAL